MAIEYVPFQGPIVMRQQAKAGGLQRYFMGPDKPCKRGHISERKTCDGRCVQCTRVAAMDIDQITAKRLRTKAWDDRHREQKNTRTSERYRLLKETDPERLKDKWRRDYHRNPQRAVAYTQRWQAQNQEHLQAYRLANKDTIAQRNREWQQANPEKVRARTRAWQERNPDYVRRWRKKNPEATRAIKLRYRAALASAEGGHTAAELKELFEKQDGRCAYCGRSIRNGYDADHIVPLSRGGSNWITNIQLCCASCNRRKWAHDHADFARRHLTKKE